MVVPPCPGRILPSVARSVSPSPSRSPLAIHAVYVGAGSEVTSHAAACSLVHVSLHPSPGAVPPSSHSSLSVSTVPSPQRGPVTVTGVHWVEQYSHVCPYSAVHACPFWLPWSHSSAPSLIPLPQASANSLKEITGDTSVNELSSASVILNRR